MTLVMYHAEQDAIRFYDTQRLAWVDMIPYVKTPTSISMLVEWGWELIGEL